MIQCFVYSTSPSPRPIAESHTFSAKEKDSETSLSYFGSRYYSSDLSIWLSVDPMSDKYPSLSPYAYCANNPIKLVDPNGEEVWIIGEAGEKFYSQLAEGACSLGISTSRDRDGKVHAEYTGEGEMSADAQKLLDAFNDPDICVTIDATNADKIDGIPFCAGAFGGNTIFEENDFCGADAVQYVNPNDIGKLENSGGFAIHEVSEAYEGAKISIKNGVSSGNSLVPNSVYKEAHNAAIAQPYVLYKYYFDAAGIQTIKSRRPVKSIGWTMPNSTALIKQVDL